VEAPAAALEEPGGTGQECRHAPQPGGVDLRHPADRQVTRLNRAIFTPTGGAKSSE